MARSVGSIEVTVEADTGKLKAQLTKAGRQAGEAAAKEIDDALDDIDARIGVEVEQAALRRAEEQIEESLDDLLASVGVRVDDNDIVRIEEQIEEQLDDLLASVGITIDDVELQETKVRIESTLDGLMATVGITPDDIDLQETQVRIESTLDGLMATVGVTPDDVDLQETRVTILRALEGMEADVEIGVNEFSLAVARAAVELSLDDMMAELGIDVAEDDLAEARAEVELSLDGILAEFGVSPDDVDLQKSRVAVLRALEGMEAEVGVEVSEFSLRLARNTIDIGLDDLLASVGVEVDDRDIAQVRADTLAELDGMLASVGVDLDQVELAEMRSALDAALEGAVAHVDIELNAASIAALEAKLDALDEEIAIQAAFDRGPIKGQQELLARIEKVKAQAEAIFTGVDIDIGIDDSRVVSDLGKIEALLRAAQIDLIINGRVDETQLLTEIESARALLRDIRADIEGDIDPIQIEALREQINLLLGKVTVAIEADLDEASFAEAAAASKAFTDKAGGGFDGLHSRIMKIAAAVLALGENLAVALQGAFAAAVSVLSSAVQGLGAAMLAAVPIAVAFGGALAAGIIGAQGFGDALKEVNKMSAAVGGPLSTANERVLGASEAFQNLAPSARAAAFAFADIRDELGDLRTVVQQDLFTGARQEIEDLAANVLPDLQEGLRISAQSVNDFARSLSDIAQNTDFTATIQAIDPALDDAFDSAEALAGSLEPFLMAAAPAAERLAEMFERGAEALQTWLLQNPEQLASFLDDGLTSLQRWVDLLQATGDLLGSIFSAGAESGDSFVVSLTNIIERWDAWMEDAGNADTIKDFFDTGREALEAFQPVLEALKDGFSDLVDADSMTNFEAFAQAIADLIPALVSVMAVLADLQLTSAIALLAQGFGVLAEVLNTLPDGMLEFIGIVIIANKAVGLLPVSLLKAVGSMVGFNAAAVTTAASSAAAATGVAGLSAALKLLVVSNAGLLALTAAVAGVMLAFKLFGGGADEAAEKAEKFQHALQNSLDTIVSAGDLSKAATAGVDALNQAMLTAGGDKLEDALLGVNEAAGKTVVTVDDLATLLPTIGEGGEEGAAAMADLAKKMGLPADAAAKLGDIVNSTDDNLEDFKNMSSDVGRQLTQLAGETGISRETLVQIAGTLEEIQDKGEDFDMSVITDEFARIELSGTDAERAALKVGEETAAAAGKAGDAQAIWFAYAEELLNSANAADDASSANGGLASSYILVNDSIQQAIAAHEAEALALAESRAKAMDAWEAELALAEATERAASSAVVAGTKSERAGRMAGNAADDIIDFGNSMRDAAGEADALNDALDLLLNPFLDVHEATSNYEEAVDDMTTAIMGGQDVIDMRAEAIEKAMEGDQAAADMLNFYADAQANANKTLDLSVPAGRENAAVVVEQVKAITDLAAANLTAGQSHEDVAAAAEIARQGLVNQTAAFFTSSEAAGTAEEQAANYINTLGLTPELISTVFTQPELVNSLLNAQNLTLLYDDMGEPVLTEFQALGIDISLEEARGLKTFVESLTGVTGEPNVELQGVDPMADDVATLTEGMGVLGQTVASPTVNLPTASETMDTIDALQTNLDGVDNTIAIPTIGIAGAVAVMGSIDALQTDLDTVDTTSVEPTILTDSISNAAHKAAELKLGIERIPSSKTITITTVQRGGGAFMAGGLVGGPVTATLGERGYAEAVVPLQLPLNRVDPSVRQFAEILRGGGMVASAPSTGKVVNNYMTITPVSADPSAVATQVINRSAAMANR